jgi:sugar O-acyltransferase (sialic acid O-acetyltransferase NeuD family)
VLEIFDVEKIVLVGYSGHAYVVADILQQQGCEIMGYMERSQKPVNPFGLAYLGDENISKTVTIPNKSKFVCAIGDNLLRRRVLTNLCKQSFISFNAIHPKTIIGSNTKIGYGLTLMAGVVINTLAEIGNGVILNTGSIIEHECVVNDFAHIAPGAVLAGNVTIGENAFIGANSVIREGIRIGKNVIVGAGSVIVRDIPDNVIIVGNPGRKLY